MPRYLLSCPKCEGSNPVATRQAGQEIECAHCGVTIDVPKLGVLKSLPVEETSTASSKAGSSRLRNWLFAGGLVLAALAGTAGGALYVYASSMYRNIDTVTAQIEDVSEQNIDAYSAVEMWDWWANVSEGELGEWKEHPGVGLNIQSGILSNVAYGLFAAAGIGLLLMASAFAVR